MQFNLLKIWNDKLLELSVLNHMENLWSPLSPSAYNGYTYTIEDKIIQKIKVNTILVLDN
jgi:hypothetical protein